MWPQCLAVEIVHHRFRREQAPGFFAAEFQQFITGFQHRVALLFKHFNQIERISPGTALFLRKQILTTAAEYDVDVAMNLLLGNQVIAVTEWRMG